MTNYICINGKKAELTEEQMKALGIELPKASPFKRAKSYYFITSMGGINEASESGGCNEIMRFNVANYCTDEAIMRERALHETLNRLLWRYSMEHKVSRVDDKVWSIKYDYDNKKFVAGWVNYKVLFLGEIAFDTEEIAKNAINEIILPFMGSNPEFEL